MPIGKKKKVTVYLDDELYEKLMNHVFSRMQKTHRFRGVITDIIVEALNKYL